MAYLGLVEDGLAIISFCLVCFATRSLFAWRFRLVGIDSWVHLLAAEEIRLNGFRIPKEHLASHFILRGTIAYPPLLHYLIAIFPTRAFLFLSRYLSAFFDAVHVALLFALVKLLTGEFLPASLAATAFVFTPRSFEESLSLTPRPLGSLLLTLTLASLLLSQTTFQGHVQLLFLISAFACALVLLCHKMATQALAFLALSLTLAGLWVSVLVLITGFALATAISRGYTLKMIREHLAILRFWSRYVAQLGSQIRITVGKIRFLGASNPWSVYPLLVLFFLPPVGVSYVRLISYFAIWSIVALLLAIVTSLWKRVMFLGQGVRYLDYAAFPSAVVVGIMSTYVSQDLLFYGLFVGLLAISIVKMRRSFRTTSRLKDYVLSSDLLDCIEAIRESPRDNVLCIPATLTAAVAYFARKRVLNTSSPYAYGELFSIFTVAGYVPIMPIEQIVRKYEIGLILVERTLEASVNACNVEAMHANSTYSVYETRTAIGWPS